MNGIEVRVSTGQVRGLMQKLQSSKGFKRGAKAAFVHLKSKLVRYPPRVSRPQSQFWTKKQRQGFFYHLKMGNIEVPYQRGTSPNSERLAQRWVIEGDGFSLVLRNNASYASRVQGREQTQYHRRGGWRAYPEVLKEERGTMQRIISQEYRKDIVG